TSNIGSHLIQSMTDKNQTEIKEAVFGELKTHFRPEFLNRVDEIVVFHGLDKANIASIAAILLKNLSARLAKVDMQLEVSDAALNKIAEVGFDPVFGARPLKRAIQQYIENPVSKMILEGKFGPNDVVPVDLDQDGEFSFTRLVH
ncbi:MAG: type VI secretion system ATPase TssH, partial [Polynucleobacter sp.]|nr:type VI secretion system ATPase TssH [Polynucleobacter sp.]